jgi:ribokinase
MASKEPSVAILGIFVADLAFRAGRQPAIGETLIGSGFAMGPGGKGSNQAVAAARAGARVSFVSKIGRDPFGQIAIAAWKAEKITPRVMVSETEPTGAAYIFVNDKNGENAIIVVPGAASTLTPADVDAAADAIQNARVFVTQLEQPVDAAKRGLEIARAAGVTTVLNPAPASGPIPDAIYPLCDYIVPNESEATGLTGIQVQSPDDAKRAGDWLVRKGARVAMITLGQRGALIHSREGSSFLPSFYAGKVVETAGAGDAFVGAFAAALAEGEDPMTSARFASAAAGISVTRPGTAPSMPTYSEIAHLLAGA